MTRRLALILALVLLAPAAAAAQDAPPPPQIDGNPLNVWTGVDGSVQVALDNAPGEFFPPGSSEQPFTSPNAGFGVVIDPQGAAQAYGPFPFRNMPAPDSGPTTGPGSVSTTWTLPGINGPALRVTQDLRYANGSRQIDATYTVTAVGDGSTTFRAFWGGDLAIRGSDSGVAYSIGNPGGRFMGGLNQEVGAAGGFVEQTPWSAFMSNGLALVSQRASAFNENPGFDNSLSAELQDNAAGVEWDDHYSAPLLSGQSVTYRVGLKFVDTLGITPLNATHQTGDEHVVSAKVATLEGQPSAGVRLVWNSTGANEANGTATTDSKGNAKFSYVGGIEGQDNLLVFADQNRNGQRDIGEPQASTIVNWTGNGIAPPVIGETVNVRPVGKGTVRVQLAKGVSGARAKALGISPAARRRFVPLRTGVQIPIGSQLDTRKGTVRLMSAALPAPNGSLFQAASFRGERFQVSQTARNSLTSLLPKDPLNGCRTKVPKGGVKKIVAARKKKRRTLFGNGKGRFRTRGRHSSATVRGTSWVQKDTCNTTTTIVKSGTVIVRDFAKKRNVRVKAGHRYVARVRKNRR